jgi:hypothetical protein
MGISSLARVSHAIAFGFKELRWQSGSQSGDRDCRDQHSGGTRSEGGDHNHSDRL